MSDVRPFRGVRPYKALVKKVASPPYDVLNSQEARKMAEGNPYTFLHINKPEIDLPDDIDPHDERVYERGARNLRLMMDKGVIAQDEKAYFYVYKQIMGNHKQAGIVAVASVAEYEKNLIKKHEFTRPDKEDDRVKHIDHQNAQVGPVFLTYRATQKMDSLIETVMHDASEYDFVSEDEVRHTLWVVRDEGMINDIRQAFAAIPALYVADGHHRSAAAMRIKQQRQAANPNHTGEENYNFFLSVIFPHNQMQILDYNRVVKDLNGNTPAEFLEKISEKFEVTPKNAPFKPEAAHTFGMYLSGKWYQLNAKPGAFDNTDPVKRLDVSILQDSLLNPVLGIEDPRKDQRIDFVGGIRGLSELEKRVDSGEWAVAFSFFPTSIDELMSIADANKVMPPKSTWFEPKLRTGLVIHVLNDLD